MPDVFRRHVFGVSLVLVGREQGISNKGIDLELPPSP